MYWWLKIVQIHLNETPTGEGSSWDAEQRQSFSLSAQGMLIHFNTQVISALVMLLCFGLLGWTYVNLKENKHWLQ